MSQMQISQVMIGDLITVERQTSVAEASNIMEESRIRHLPITENGQLVGIVSQRDLYKSTMPSDPVMDYMTEAPYIVFEDEAIEDVVRNMAHGKFGSVLIINNEFQLCGIFTTIDALNMLAEVLSNKTESQPQVPQSLGDLKLAA